MLRFGFKIEGDPVKALADRLASSGNAVAAAVAEAGTGLRNELRNQWRATHYSSRLANTWSMKFYRNQGLNAAAIVYSKAPTIMRGFVYGAVIRAKSGKFLAIPTGFNRQGGRRGGRPLITAEQMAKAGRGMTFVRRSKAGTLLWFIRVLRAQRRQRGRIRDLATAGGFHIVGGGRVKRTKEILQRGAVPMFILVRQVRLPKVLDLKGAATRAQVRIASLVSQYWR